MALGGVVGVGEALEKELAARAAGARRADQLLHLTAPDQPAADELVRRAVAAGATVRALVPTRESLEDYFLRVRREAGGGGGDGGEGGR